MARQKKAVNPFYVLLVIVGVAFGITALAYGVMAAIGHLDPAQAMESIESGRGLVALMDKHGTTLMLAELGVLFVLTCLAISTDSFWTGRASEQTCDSPDTDYEDSPSSLANETGVYDETSTKQDTTK